ncbi:MAG: hypothetical protein HYY59_02635 [Candidatus Omnitrophica bacterium]|nr:hypothetical protein [Candidatus Omnitrophota bacterium]
MAYLPSSTPNPQPSNALAALLGKPSVQPSQSALQQLADLIEKLTRKGHYYHRQTIFLDGFTFEECSFENCHLITRNGTFIMRNCRISGSDTQFIYQGEALKIIRLHELMNASVLGRSVFPQLLPKIDADWRITIE